MNENTNPWRRVWLVGVLIWAVYEGASLIRSDDWITTISQQVREFYLSLTWSYKVIVVAIWVWLGLHWFGGLGMKVVERANAFVQNR